jgi:hypothetical protein
MSKLKAKEGVTSDEDNEEDGPPAKRQRGPLRGRQGNASMASQEVK